MIRFGLTAAVCLSILTALAPLADADTPHRPKNLSSHPPEFFRDLLGGRVFVWKHRGQPAAILYRDDRAILSCWFDPRRDKFLRNYTNAEWKIGTPAGKSNIEERWFSMTGNHRVLRRVIIYTPSTGRFHFEARDPETEHWRIIRDGWVQDAWPKALVRHCPLMNLPNRLPIEQSQASLDFDLLKANANPIRNHRGSHIRFPGATGLAASRGQPTLSLQEVETTFRRYHQHLAIAPNGSRIVFLTQPDHREIWRLDQAHNVLDVGIMRLASNGTVMHTRWEKSGRRSKFLVGYPLPGIPTDELHPVFAMMDELTASRTAVSLPSITSKPLDHVFASNGTVRTRHSAGTWHISRGAVHVDIDGARRAWPWREFARRAGWTG